MQRRDFIKQLAATGLIGAPWFEAHAVPARKVQGRVVVIGAGYAGTTLAKYLRIWSGYGIEVVVVEQNTQFVSCPLSNLVLGGSRSINDLTFGYGLLQKHHGIQWVHDQVTHIDTAARKVTMSRGEMTYDRLVVAPGIDFNYSAWPEMQNAEAQRLVPHAWKAGPQTLNLRQQLESMPDGGVVVISIPKAPFRCPPGPYERTCQVAFYLKLHKPKSKVIVLDANPDIVSKKALFLSAWKELYPGIVDYRPNSTVLHVNPVTREVETEFERVKADVLNIIPPQRAGKPAQMAGLLNVDNNWCAVDFRSYASTISPEVHVLGDAVFSPQPKSAHIATSHAHVCANAIVAMMGGQEPDPEPVFANTCYSFVSDRMAVHVANVYRYDAEKKLMVTMDGGGLSDVPSDLEGTYAQSWARNIWSDALT
ncbi:NAD(P)/FAD-dependent oxidoreductase [Methylobacillus caricis]|uniref:NAD(P)/FAD-dependent oxidoreductase n=1 Tax=Methylobacillus caricis TaxID=1971611 RepID=UPI001CFF9DC6|nr:NAD(P)/FAD-dependent oxidoreductase [Methylobacillus caricis]MCB5187017.1 NAD(P)/FAD-dependent oxidoreductase [Methylobacillus caricis]